VEHVAAARLRGRARAERIEQIEGRERDAGWKLGPPICRHFIEPAPPTNTRVHGLSTPVLVQFVPASVGRIVAEVRVGDEV
jgi:hypothetical protein